MSDYEEPEINDDFADESINFDNFDDNNYSENQQNPSSNYDHSGYREQSYDYNGPNDPPFVTSSPLPDSPPDARIPSHLSLIAEETTKDLENDQSIVNEEPVETEVTSTVRSQPSASFNGAPLRNSATNRNGEFDQGSRVSNNALEPISKPVPRLQPSDNFYDQNRSVYNISPESNLRKQMKRINHLEIVQTPPSANRRTRPRVNREPEDVGNTTWGNGLGSSFNAASPHRGAMNYSEEFAQGSNAFNVINEAQEAFNKSGRRLQIPEQFNDENHLVQNTTWEQDNGYNRNRSRTNPFDRPSGSTASTAVEPPLTPRAVRFENEEETPEPPSRFREAAFAISTPKPVYRGIPQKNPNFGDLSAINTTADSTLDQSTRAKFEKLIKNMDTKTSASVIISAIDNVIKEESKVKREKHVDPSMEFPLGVSQRDPLREMQPRVPPSPDISVCKCQSRMVPSTASSLETVTNHRSNDSPSNSQAVSHPSSRRSSVTTDRESASPTDIRLSTGSASDRCLLSFGYVEPGSSFIESFRIFNSGQVSQKLTLSLRKNNAGFKILDWNTRRLEAGKDVEIKVEFSPLQLARHNNLLLITTNLLEFNVKLRGTGGIASLSLKSVRERLEKTINGNFIMKPARNDGRLQLKLCSTGQRRVFSKIFVYGDGQLIDSSIWPSDGMSMRGGSEQIVELTIPDLEGYITPRDTASTVSAAGNRENIRLKICIYWGDDVQRQRAQSFLKKSGRSSTDSIIQTLMETKYQNERPFLEPEDWRVSPDDLKEFQLCLSKTEIAVLPLARLSTDFDYDWDSQPDGDSVEENTYVVDCNDTTIMSRR